MMFSSEIRPLGQFCLFVCLYLFCGFIRLEMKKNRHDECTLARRNSPAYLIRSTLVAIK